MKKLISILLALLCITGCTKPAEPTLTKHSNMSIDSGFDTYLSLQAATASDEEFNGYFNDACARFSELNQLFDIYNDYENVNNLKTINDNAGIAPVEVNEDIIEMLEIAKEFYELSNGQFDITMGSVMKIWHEYRTEGIELNEQGQLGNIPELAALEAAKEHSGWEHIIIDKENKTVYIDDPEVSLDVGGVAKGFAAESIAQRLTSEGIAMGIVDAGGNNRMINSKLDGTPWNVGIQDPGNSGLPALAGGILAISKEGSGSFVTSGDYQRNYTAEDGKIYHHIIDPSTLFPADYFHSVSIVMKDSARADAMSTTLFTMSYEDGLALIEEYNKSHDDNVGVVWIMDEPIDAEFHHQVGNYFVVYTSNLEGMIKWSN